MTVYQLLDDIFSRPQQNVESWRRYITRDQLELLERLIAEDRNAVAVLRRLDGFTWSPAGDWRYVVTQYPDGRRRSITKEPAARAGSQGSLF
jgi:hypothetical protein